MIPHSLFIRLPVQFRQIRKIVRITAVCVLAALGTVTLCQGQDSAEMKTAPAPEMPEEQRLAPMLDYIKKSWQTLTRSHADLLNALVDPKVEHEDGTPWTLYVSAKEDPEAVLATLSESLGEEEIRQIRVAQLPENPQEHMSEITPHGLLYLPHPYVVPGGRFNEMYGWDSYFIQVGLLLDDEVDLAKNMIDNFLYQIEH